MSAARGAVTLREITGETVRAVCRLSDTLEPNQQRMVAPNALSIAEAYFEPHAWFRAIYEEEEPVGFVMLYDAPEKDYVYLWRFMIAAPHQRRSVGSRALELVFEHARARPGVREVRASYVPIEGGAGPSYEKLGFVPTGEVDAGEVVIRRPLR
ncbi:MAG: GNAT family N-acetyltransferase [Candidatus Bipolaricaulota bacterium]